MDLTDKLIIVETDEMITVADYVRIFEEVQGCGFVIADAMNNIDYCIKHGLLKKYTED